MTLATRRPRFGGWGRKSTRLPREAWVLIAANAVAALTVVDARASGGAFQAVAWRLCSRVALLIVPQRKTRLRHLQPDYNFKQFEAAFHLVDDLRRIYRKAARAMHIPE